jgi:hypothetical protein
MDCFVNYNYYCSSLEGWLMFSGIAFGDNSKNTNIINYADNETRF